MKDTCECGTWRFIRRLQYIYSVSRTERTESRRYKMSLSHSLVILSAPLSLSSSVAGPAPALVRSVWGLLAPASSDSDSDTASPAPDQPRSGMVAQLWVLLRTDSAACESPAS